VSYLKKIGHALKGHFHLSCAGVLAKICQCWVEKTMKTMQFLSYLAVDHYCCFNVNGVDIVLCFHPEPLPLLLMLKELIVTITPPNLAPHLV
jgi:hypothetical protein